MGTAHANGDHRSDRNLYPSGLIPGGLGCVGLETAHPHPIFSSASLFLASPQPASSAPTQGGRQAHALH